MNTKKAPVVDSVCITLEYDLGPRATSVALICSFPLFKSCSGPSWCGRTMYEVVYDTLSTSLSVATSLSDHLDDKQLRVGSFCCVAVPKAFHDKRWDQLPLRTLFVFWTACLIVDQRVWSCLTRFNEGEHQKFPMKLLRSLRRMTVV